MKFSKVIILILFFAASCNDTKLQNYTRIVNSADKFEVHFKNTSKIITIPDSLETNIKDIFTRNIKPELQRNFINDVSIQLYRGGIKIATLLITTNVTKPFVNFKSDSLNFGFPLTYGIGMTIYELYN